MPSSAQIELWPAEKVAAQANIGQAPNGINFAGWGETRVSEADLERLVGAVPALLAPALRSRAYYFVPLALADTGEVMIAPSYSVDLGDRAVCHRNTTFGATEAVFLSTRLVEDRFGLAFEFFINVAHNFTDVAGVPESFSRLVWSQAEAQVRGETSQDAWEARRRALDSRNGQKVIDETRPQQPTTNQLSPIRSPSTCCRSQSTSTITICASVNIRCWRRPLWRSACGMWPDSSHANAGYEFQILYRRKG